MGEKLIMKNYKKLSKPSLVILILFLFTMCVITSARQIVEII